MRAIVVDRFGDESVMRIADVDPPPLRENSVRIGVHGTAVNRADVLQRQGHYAPPPGGPDILGLECAGEVLESNVPDFRKGERVMALLAGGGYAEEVVADAGSVMRVPDALSWTEAGAIPEVFLTAFLNVFELARAKKGETLLVHGGGSGVGTAATTLGKLAGLRVIVTAGTDEKCRQCVAHGAGEAINYNTDDFVKRVRSADVILDHIGAPYFVRNLRALATSGRLVLIGSMGGREPVTLDLTALLSKRQQIIASTLRARPADEKRAIVAAFLSRFGDDLRDGRVRPVIDSVFPLERAADAHRRMGEDHFGKIALTV